MAKRLAHLEYRFRTAAYRSTQKRFVTNLSRIRKARRLTQEQAAALCQMTMQQYQHIESGDANVTILTLSRLIEGLGIDVVDLFAPLSRR